MLAHGTTVATNALLRAEAGRVALVTTRGFADVIEIARQARPSLYDPRRPADPPLVPRERRVEVAGDSTRDGRELEPFDGIVPDLPAAVDAVAVCLLHADLDPVHEQAVAAVLRARGADVVCSHEVSPEFREYERTVTDGGRRRAAPGVRGVPSQLGEPRGRRAGDDVGRRTGSARRCASRTRPRLLLSGPAAGVRAAAAIAVACGLPDAVAFDMGGTSTDVCLIRGGVPEPAASAPVAGLPVRLPALAVHTIGAGGGSIAGLDTGGALVVGPESAGAHPGPAAYGLGGTGPP